MRVVIDAGFVLGSQEKGGIVYLMDDFLNALQKLDKYNKYIIFGYFFRNYFKRGKNLNFPSSKNFSFKIYPFPNSLIKNIEKKFKIPIVEIILKKENPDIYHSISGKSLPYLKKMKKVITIHDLGFEIKKNWYKDNWYSDIKNSAINADIIITPSYFTKKNIIEFYKIPEEKVKVIYNGVNNKLFKLIEDMKEIEIFKNKYDFNENYILTVITSIKRKNFDMSVDVYKKVKKSFKIDMVVICGSKNVKKEAEKIIKEKNLKDIKLFAEIEKKEMPFFYNFASVFFFPSLYEGFGLPVVEAMACGCPVITSNISCLPEVGGDACLYVDPYNVEEMVEVLKKVLKDDSLRVNMKTKGLERAKLFSWEKAARETIKIYESLIG